jgi:hypothetical protein
MSIPGIFWGGGCMGCGGEQNYADVKIQES